MNNLVMIALVFGGGGGTDSTNNTTTKLTNPKDAVVAKSCVSHREVSRGGTRHSRSRANETKVGDPYCNEVMEAKWEHVSRHWLR